MRILLLSVVTVGATAAAAAAAGIMNASDYEDLDPKRDFCVHAFHQSAVLDSMLYINGGSVVYNYNNTRYEGPNTYLRALDLSSRFTLNDPSSTPFAFTPTPSLVPDISSGALWADTNSTLYLASGVTNNSSPDWTSNTLWTYHPPSNTWVDIATEPPATNRTTPPSLASASTAFLEHDTHGGRLGTGFLAGGNQDGTGYPGMLEYNATARSWTNHSTPFQQRSSGAMVHIPVGEKGILLLLGGIRNNLPFNMSRVEIYNLDSGDWSSSMQPAMGRDGVPEVRSNFCGVVATARGSEFEIFVYGGTSAGNSQLGDVWVLSVPSFEWFKVDSRNGTTGPTAPGRREGHSCHAVGRYMLVYGGRSIPQDDQACDRTGVFAFDMVDLKWVEEFVPGGTYKVPGVVADYLNSSTRFTQLGLADPSLEDMFGTDTDTDADADADTDPNIDPGEKAKLIAIMVCVLVAGAGVIGFLVYTLREQDPPPVTETTYVEVPSFTLTPHYTPGTPGQWKPQAWEMSASPRDPTRVGFMALVG